MKSSTELRQYKRRMKRQETVSERAFRLRLEAAKILHKRQVIVGFYIVDFIITNRMCAVEINGSSHVGREAYDERRENFLRDCGLHVVHIDNEHVETFNLEAFKAFPWVDAKECNRAFGKANAIRSRVRLQAGLSCHS